MGRKISTKSIQGFAAISVAELYGQREAYYSYIKSLEIEIVNNRKPNLEAVKEISQAKLAVERIEDRLIGIGLPVDPNELVANYHSVGEALDSLMTAQEISGWIKGNYPQRYKNKLSLLNSPNHALNPRMTGKWQGIFKSDNHLAPGEVIMAICQVDDLIIGSGAFTGSVFSLGYLEGKYESDKDVLIELFSDSVPLVCRANAKILERENRLVAEGHYEVADYDFGTFTASKDEASKYVVTISDRAKLRQLLVNAFSDAEIKTLCFDLEIDYEQIQGSTKDERARELILFTERRGMKTALIELCRISRPNIVW